MIDAVESIAANPLLEPLVRAGIGCRRQRHRAMKACVKDRDLRHWAQHFRNDLHTFQFGAIVERRKNRSAFDRRLDLSGYERRLEVLRTTVDDPVSHNMDGRRTGNYLRVAAPQSLEQALEGVAPRGHSSLFSAGNVS